MGAAPDLAQRYAPRWYFTATAYDAADRPTHSSAGLRSAQLQGARVNDSPIPMGNGDPDFGKSTLVTDYTARGTLRDVLGSYGTLLAGIQRRADGLVESVTYGDLAGTTTVTGYDGRRRPTSIQTYRAAPGAWTTFADTGSSGGITYNPPPGPAHDNGQNTLQLILQDLDITYDIVGNPTEIRDWRDPAEWPSGAKPVTRKIAYDDLYRVRQIKYEYTDGDDAWTSPFAKENEETFSDGSFDHRRSMPSPHVKFDNRVLEQNIAYDWLGNTETTDDDAHGFYDRSLGTITNNSAAGKPYQLIGANNSSKGGDRTGSLDAKYDVAGNLTDMAVTRSVATTAGLCLPSGAGCSQTFHYEWDEVGRLVHAQRWDLGTAPDQLGILPPSNAAADLAYTYDASDNRVIKTATALEGNERKQRHSVYISGGQELRGAQFAADYLDPGATGADYEVDSKTEIAYLFAHGVRLGRVAYDNGAGMPAFSESAVLPEQHVLINLDDTLGSTSIVIDKATGELVESTAYLAHGATESDYRPDRWKGLREDYRFTGKEEDVEVGLQYFGKRFLSPYLGRWVSADPLATHEISSDLNLYSYVKGRVLRAVDPVGLKDADLNAYAEQNERRSEGNRLTPEQVVQAWKKDHPGQKLHTSKPAQGPTAVTTSKGRAGPGAQGTKAESECTGSDCGGGGTMAGYSAGDKVTIGVGLMTGNASADKKKGVTGGIPGGTGPAENAGTGKQVLWGSVEVFGHRLVEAIAKAMAMGGKLLTGAIRAARQLPEHAGPTGHIPTSEIAGKTPGQIDARARELGLQPKGPDPAHGRGSYVDPQTGEQRILSHPNDTVSGPHGHVNDIEGNRIGPDGQNVLSDSPEAHLPIKTE